MNRQDAAQRSYSEQAVHLLRTATLVNMTLSQMADQKASILMGATFVVFTISVGQAGRGNFAFALVVLALFSFLSALSAMMAVMPSIQTGKAGPERRNILFFGVFSHLSEEEFAADVLDHLETDEDLYRTMLRDIYQNGQVLQHRKYRYLGIAYRIFMVGLVLTLAVFLFESSDQLARLF